MKKLFIVFFVGDGGDSESYSVYNSHIVEADSKEEAIDKYFSSKYNSRPIHEKIYFDAMEVEHIIK